MVRKRGTPKVKITTNIPIEDFNWCTDNKLTYSQLLESAISIHRNAVNDGIEEDYYKYLKNKIELLGIRLTSYSRFLDEKGILGEFLENEKKEMKGGTK